MGIEEYWKWVEECYKPNPGHKPNPVDCVVVGKDPLASPWIDGDPDAKPCNHVWDGPLYDYGYTTVPTCSLCNALQMKPIRVAELPDPQKGGAKVWGASGEPPDGPKLPEDEWTVEATKVWEEEDSLKKQA